MKMSDLDRVGRHRRRERSGWPVEARADDDLGSFGDRGATGPGETVVWMVPEVYCGSASTSTSDVWSW
jgi:hypothetical protein